MESVLEAFRVQQDPQARPEHIRDANLWLERFQSTTEAWTVADGLLSLPAEQVGNGSAHVFAAQTLRAKIQYDWAELPPQSHAALRDSLLAHAVRFSAGPQVVLTQLCLAVATLALHMEAWGQAVPELIGRFTSPPAEALAKLPCLLELLTVMPEEAENFKVAVMPRRRDEFRGLLRGAGPQVVALLGQVQEQCRGSSPLVQACLRCTASWLKAKSVPADCLMASPLVGLAFAALDDQTLFDEGVDMLVELVHFSKEADSHAQLVAGIMPPLLALGRRYDAAVQAGDEEVARALVRLFAETGEQYLHLLLTQQPEWLVSLAACILRGAAHPDADVAEITFNFWYMLAEELNGGGRSLNDAQRVDARGRFADCFRQLLQALRSLVEFPSESDSWPADQADDFRRFRYAVGDVLTDACKVLSSTACIEEVYGALQQRLPAFGADPAGQWRSIEACVFCARQMITSNEPAFFTAPVVHQLLQLLPTLPAAGNLPNTAIRTVGTYANWLSRHAEMLPQMLTYVTSGLQQQRNAAAASQAMKHLCDACTEHLAEEGTMAQLVQMYLGTLSFSLEPADRVDLVAALSFVVSQLPLPQVLPAMEAIARPLLQRLQAALEGGGGPGEVSVLLEQLCALLGKVSPGARPTADEVARVPALQDSLHPSVHLLQQLWGVLEAIFERHGGDSRVMEKLCRCYKHTSRNTAQGPFRGDFRSLVPRLLPQVTGWFERQPHSCFLYVANVCLRGYHDAPELLPTFCETFARMSAVVFRLLSAAPTAIPDNPDVVDDFFELCSTVLRLHPALLAESELLLSSFQCGCAALRIQHREANRAVVGFFEMLLVLRQAGARGNLSPAAFNGITTLLVANGAQLAQELLLAIGGLVPPARVRFLSPVLKGLILVDYAASRIWLEAAVQALPPGGHMDGATLLQAIYSAEALARDDRGAGDRVFGQAVEAFSNACRRRRLL